MNTKVENRESSTGMDYVKYVVAAAIAIAGIVVFYLFPQWPAAVRGLIVFFGLALAAVVFSLSYKGGIARAFLADAIFELRKVVWPTREEAFKVTVMVMVVVVIISLILAAFDFGISAVIKWLLGS